MPEISAIITTFNRANFLKKAIRSALNQTFKDFELLILDNNSTDETETVVKGFPDKKIKYIKHRPLNISQARNLGIKEAKGKYIAFLDDDDDWLPNKLKDQIEIFKKEKDPEVMMIYGGFIRTYANSKKTEKYIPQSKGKITATLLWQKDPVTGSASNPLIKKEIFKKIGGYDEKVLTGEDWEFYLRLSKKYKINFTDKIVLNINQHPGPRLGYKIKEAIDLEILIINKYQEIFKKNRRLLSFYLQKIGGKFCRINQAKKGKQYLKKAIEKNPLNYLAYFQYLFSFLGTKFYQKIHKTYKNATRSHRIKNIRNNL